MYSVASYPVFTANCFFCMLEKKTASFFSQHAKKLAVETGYEASYMYMYFTVVCVEGKP